LDARARVCAFSTACRTRAESREPALRRRAADARDRPGAHDPRLLILDEATEGLAPQICIEIYSAIQSLKASGLSILIIDKDLKSLMRVADRHYVIEKGRVLWSGASPELAESREMRHRYLGV
jgi:ABC-type branched-subunit amino acid transport system ATPase component